MPPTTEREPSGIEARIIMPVKQYSRGKSGCINHVTDAILIIGSLIGTVSYALSFVCSSEQDNQTSNQ